MKISAIGLLSLLFAPFLAAAQTELPLNINQAYVANPGKYKAIRVTTTYNDGGKYQQSDVHYFNSKQLNSKTIGYSANVPSTKTTLQYDDRNNLIKVREYRQELGAAGPSKDARIDSTWASWETTYAYNKQGLISRCTHTWYDEDNQPEHRHELTFRYDAQNRVTEEVSTDTDLSAGFKVYFQAGSDKLAADQNPPATSVSTRQYSYDGGTTVIRNYEEDQLKTTQVITRAGNVQTEVLRDETGKLVRTTTTTYNLRNQKLKEVVSGDARVSVFNRRGDGMTFDTILYDYNTAGLLKRATYTNTRFKHSQYTDYEYYN